MEIVHLESFYRMFLLAAIITMRSLILKILCGDEGSISIFHFLYKAIVPVYCSLHHFCYQKRFYHAAYASSSL